VLAINESTWALLDNSKKGSSASNAAYSGIGIIDS
jgi:hypothetical protein